MLATVLPAPLAGGTVPLLLRLVLPPDGRPPVVVLTELAGSSVPWTDPVFAGAVADVVVQRFGVHLQAAPDRVLWFADHAPDGPDAGLLRRLDVRQDGAGHRADPRDSEALTPEGAAWWRGALALLPAHDVLPQVAAGQRSASATASDRSR